MELYYWTERTEIDIDFSKAKRRIMKIIGEFREKSEKETIKWKCKCGKDWTIGISFVGGE